MGTGRLASGLLVSIVLVLGWNREAPAIAMADDTGGFSESDTQTISFTFAGALGPIVPPAGPGSLKFLFKHWGDTTPAPAAFTDKLGGGGSKPAFPAAWNGTTISNSHTTVHPFGSVSVSTWETRFVIRQITVQGRILLAMAAVAAGLPPPPPAGFYPGINGKLTAVADAANFRRGANAHTRTDWSDPIEFDLPAGSRAMLAILHEFANDGVDITLAEWLPDVLGETGSASVARTFVGRVTDSQGVLGDPIGLQAVRIGTTEDLVDVSLGPDVFFVDGTTLAEKTSQLLAALDVANSRWLLPQGESISLGFAWVLPEAAFDRVATLDIRWALTADEASVPQVRALPLLASGLIVLAARLRRGNVWREKRRKPSTK